MKVLLINGSTRENGCVYNALSEIARVLNEEGVETEILQMGLSRVYDCNGCNYCHNSGKGRCIHDDDEVNDWIKKAEQADGFIFGSPVYYSHPSGQFLSLLDRMFYAASDKFMYKPGAAIVTARRAGTVASIDVLNKYFTDACMPVVSSTYWNMVHGRTPEDTSEDAEGMQTMRNIGRNMAWLLKCIEAGKKAGIALPEPEIGIKTNFIR